MHTPQGPFKDVGHYEVPINGRQCGIVTLVSRDMVIAWMPDTEQQHVNPQYRDSNLNVPVMIREISELDIARMLGQVLLFQTKKELALEHTLREHDLLINRILNDFKYYSI